MHDLLNAESASIFLVDPEAPRYLDLRAEFSDLKEHEFVPVRIEMHHRLHGGLTGFIAQEGRLFNSFGDSLQFHEYSASKVALRHLKNGCQSLIAIPVKDRKGRLLALIKVDNKKDYDHFGEEDEAIATLLAANPLALALEMLRVEDAFQTLIGSLRSANSLTDLLTVALKKGLPLVDAYRGDFIWWHEDRKELLVEAKWGASVLDVGARVPTPSVVNRVFSTGKRALIQDISNSDEAPDYFTANTETLSEMALPLIGANNECVGVLNVEFARRAGFDPQVDLDLLDSLARYATAAAQEVHKRVTFVSVAERAYSGANVLKRVLLSLEQIFHFDAGVVFAADRKTRRLLIRETLGCDHLSIDSNRLFFSLDETALATKVFNTKAPYFSAEPGKDPEVSQRMWKDLQIQGPLLGLPLVWEGRVPGVLVVWSRKGEEMKKEDAKTLAPFQLLAAATLSALESEQRKRNVLYKIASILAAIQRGALRETVLDLICQSVAADGFERVRVFVFRRQPDRFVGVHSLGMPGRFEGSEVLVDSNPYALQTLKDALRVHLQARQYPVASLGPDPNRDMFGKAEATPWAIVPMATATQVYGQIAADMGRTDEEPTLDQLEFLTILGALATQALANDEILNLRSRLASDEAVKQVLHNAFHDIKTPAISIAANAEIAADRSRDPGKRDEALQSLLEDAKRMEHLIRQSSDYTWTGLGPQDPRRVSLREIVERGTRRLVPVAARAGVSLEVDLPNVPCEIEGDANRLYVALDNLVDNAIKFSPKGSSVWVRLKPGDRGYRVEVLDDGPGAPRDSKIFDPFVSVAHSGVPESSGLGLAITKKIIEDHGGALNYGTGTGGKGSVFSFLLPAVLLS